MGVSSPVPQRESTYQLGVCGTEYTPDGAFAEHVRAACAAASAAVLGLIRREEGLLGALGGLRHYFLLARGDLFTSLLDSAREELGRRADELSVPRMQGLLELGAPPSPKSMTLNLIFLNSRKKSLKGLRGCCVPHFSLQCRNICALKPQKTLEP